jgi:hemolysin-activating ACP:hemolysin acyltransferase
MTDSAAETTTKRPNSSNGVAANTAVTDETPIKTFAPTKAQQERLSGQIVSSNFGNIVTILMQSQHYKTMQLHELKERVVPPLLANQFRVAEAGVKGSGQTAPVALLLWARVSNEVHERLSAMLDKPLELAPDEWQSGEHYWIIDAIGDQRFLTPLLTELRKNEFKGRTVHYRAHTNGEPELRTFRQE